VSEEAPKLLVTTTQDKNLIIVRVTGNEVLLKLIGDAITRVVNGERRDVTIDWKGELIGASQPMKIILSLLPTISNVEGGTPVPPTPGGGLN